MTDPAPTNQRCESTSPICKLDEGPAQCRKEKGHTGFHMCNERDAKYVDPLYDYERLWDDEGRIRG